MGRRSNSRNSADPIERVPFKIMTFFNAAAGSTLSAPTVSAIDLAPAIDTRLAAIADAFQWYRFSKLMVTLLPATTATNDTDASVGYIPRIPNSAPTLHSELVSLPASAVKGRGQSVPAKMLVSRAILFGDAPIKWYQTKVGTEDAQWEVQGQYIFAANVVSAAVLTSQVYTVEGVCDFKGRSALTQTPLYKQPKPLPLATQKESSIPSIVVGDAVYKLASA